MDNFDHRLERLLKAEKEHCVEGLIKGTGFDISEYKFQLGLIHGIQRAMDLVEEVRGALSKEDGF